MRVEDIAAIAHEANRMLCLTHGDTSQTDWMQAPDWQRESAINGVLFHIANPSATPEDSHVSWMKEKASEGWKYGPAKSPENKEHPCMVPYAELPAEERAKDYLFRGIVHALIPFAD